MPCRHLPILLQRVPGAPMDERILDVAYVPLMEADGTRSGVVVHGTDDPLFPLVGVGGIDSGGVGAGVARPDVEARQRGEIGAYQQRAGRVQ